MILATDHFPSARGRVRAGTAGTAARCCRQPSRSISAYVLISCILFCLFSISILRGFACAATGIRSVSTPAS